MNKKQLVLYTITLLVAAFLLPDDWRDRVSSSSLELRKALKPSVRLGRIQNPLTDKDIVKIEISEDESAALESYKDHQDPIRKYVKASIEFEGVEYDCSIRLHGTDRVHRIGNQTSYRIKLDKSGTFYHGARSFQLIKTSETSTAILAANNIARRLGLISSTGRLVQVEENGETMGIYMLVEAIDKTFLEREFGITNYAQVANTSDWTRKEGNIIHITELDLRPEHIQAEKGTNFRRALYQFSRLGEAVDQEDIQATANFFNTDYAAKFLAVAMIFNDIHFVIGDNLKLIYNFDDGKFYPVFRIEHWGKPLTQESKFYDSYGIRAVENFDRNLFTSSSERYDMAETSKLFKLLVANEPIRMSRNDFLASLMVDTPTSFIQEGLKKTYQNNQGVKYHVDNQNQYLRIETEEQSQQELVVDVIELCKQYLGYTHIYGSYDKSADMMSLVLDSYLPIEVIDTLTGAVLSNNHVGLSLDSKLNNIYKELILSDVRNDLEKEDLVFVNQLTGDTVNSKRVYINRISSKGRLKKKDASEIAFLKKYNIKHKIFGDSLTILPGSYKIDKNNSLSEFSSIVIMGGVEFKFDKKSSLHVECQSLYVSGTNKNPVKFGSLNEAFGNVSFRGVGQNPKYKIDYLIVENGAFSRWNGKATTGQFSIFNADVELTNSIFRNSKGDDGLNLKYCKAAINHCQFYLNNADQVDLDFCIAKVSDCTFKPSGVDANGDGLDFSGSYAKVANCHFEGFEDKSMSVGERSLVFIGNNTFVSNNWSICAKDQSNAFAYDNSFKDNNKNYIGYVKKNMFAPPTIYSFDESIEISDTLQLAYKKMALDTLSSKLKRFEEIFESFRVSSGLGHKQQVDEILLKELTF